MKTCETCGKCITGRAKHARYCTVCVRKREAASRTVRTRYHDLAHRYVEFAVRHGDLPKLDGSVACVDCGAPADAYDHRDYKKPMEVDPVCRACNLLRGPGLHRDPSETATKPLTIRQRFDRRSAA